jgi:hypothetical protein
MSGRSLLRLRFAVAAVGVAALAALVGCQGGPPCIFGYQLGADALYDPNIKSVYVPVFSNRAFQTTPERGIEVDITKAVVREIGAKTKFKIVSDPTRADTELLGNVVSITKTVLNRDQQNLIREAEIVLTVDVLWRDLRDGTILSAPRRGKPGPGGAPVLPSGEPIPPFDPDVPLPPPVAVVQPPTPTRLIATGRMLPELGESSTTAQQRAVNLLATQIVSLMEKPW